MKALKNKIAAICMGLCICCFKWLLKIKFRYTVPTHLSKENMSLYMEEDKDFVSRKMTICENMQKLPSQPPHFTMLLNHIIPTGIFYKLLLLTHLNVSNPGKNFYEAHNLTFLENEKLLS